MMGTATAIAAIVAFAVTAAAGLFAVPFLRRLKFGQNIKTEYGPKWHRSKQGTPTMGGIMIVLGVVAGTVVAVMGFAVIFPGVLSGEVLLQQTKLWAGLLMALSYGLIGFFDDYIKVVKKRNLGLMARQKLILQVLVALGYAFAVYMAGDTGMNIPFVGSVNFGWAYIPIMVFIIVGMVNAVNLTDGIDGLATSVTFIVAVCFMLCAGILNMLGICILSSALAGACMGFLLWNFYPAKVFMGDTGSLFLGGMVCAVAFGIDMPLLIILPAGVIYVVETASVILQVFYFKVSHGKRLFKMSPLHHHYEMKGKSEIWVNSRFTLVTFLACIFTFLLVYFGYVG